MNRDVCEHFNPVDLLCDKCKSASVQKSTLREAAQQALEAMETVELDIEWRAASPTHKMLSKAITALRAALAEQTVPSDCTDSHQPVAWRWGYRSVTTGEMDWRGYVEIAADPNLRSPAIIMQPLYTAPPQRKWTGLTEAERVDIIDDEITEQNSEHWALAQAIEAALKKVNT